MRIELGDRIVTVPQRWDVLRADDPNIASKFDGVNRDVIHVNSKVETRLMVKKHNIWHM